MSSRMRVEPIRFHAVHGNNIQLSGDGTEAARFESFNQALCFTHRPLVQSEKLVIKIIDASKSWSGTLRVGVTEHDPSVLGHNLPKYVCPDLNMQPGNWGKALEEPYVKLNNEITIYHENGKVMIKEGDRPAEQFITGIPKNKPLYVLFDVYGNTKKIRIGLKNSLPAVVPGAAGDAGATAAEAPIGSAAYGTATFSRASFLAFDSENVKVSSTTATSQGQLYPRSHFAVTETALKAKQTLVVRLKRLRNSGPIQIVLTTEPSVDVYEFGHLDKLVDKTYSLDIKSGNTKQGEDLAITIAENGVVYTSHDDRQWAEQVHVDAGLKYHVVFDMENVTEMLMLGISEDIVPKKEHAVPAKQVPGVKKESLRDPDPNTPPDCIICLEVPRSVLLEPCSHYALCEPCARQLQRSDRRECPVCRALIKGIKKIYMI